MLHSLLLVLFAVAISVLSQLSLQAGMSHVGAIGSDSAPSPTILLVMQNPWSSLASAHILGAAAWPIVLSHLDLNCAYRLLTLNFLLISLAS